MKRAIAIDDRLWDKVADSAKDHSTNWNRMAVTLIEFGLPLLSKAERTCPGLLRAKLTNHYTYRQRERLSVTLDRIADKQQMKMKLAAGIFVGMTQQTRDSIRQEAKTRNKYMTEIVRERMGLGY